MLASTTALLLAPLGVSAQDVILESLDRPVTVYEADGLLPDAKARGGGRWRTDIVFGLPIALRVQHELKDTGVWLEGGVAAYGDIPGVFLGVRFDGRVFEGRRNAWFSRPGVDVYYSPVRINRRWDDPSYGIATVALDTDLSWQHKWSDRLHSHLGVKLGLGVAFAGRWAWPVPIVGLTGGFQY